jgi:hypothetical protein
MSRCTLFGVFDEGPGVATELGACEVCQIGSPVVDPPLSSFWNTLRAQSLSMHLFGHSGLRSEESGVPLD